MFRLYGADFLVGSNFLKHATQEHFVSAQPCGGARKLFQKQSLVSKKKQKKCFLEKKPCFQKGYVSQKGLVF